MSQSDRPSQVERYCTELAQDNERLRQANDRLTTECDRLAAQCDRLRKSESRYRQIFENAPMHMCFYAADGCVTQVNSAFEQINGVTLDAISAQRWNLFDDPQLVENGTLPYMQKAFVGEAVIEPPTYYDVDRSIPSGKLIYGRGHYVPIRNATGEVEEIVEICADLTIYLELQQKLLAERELAESQRHRAAQERARLLGTIAQVANLLLRSPNYTTVLPDVVRLLGEAVGSDRCSILRSQFDADLGKARLIVPYAWQSSDVTDFAQATSMMFWEDFGDHWTNFSRGEISNVLVEAQPEPARSLFRSQGCTSMLFVPILASGQCWGVIGFDDCGEPRLYDEAEVAILKVAADGLAAAIERQAKDEELRKSEALYRSLFEISNEGIFRFEFEPPIALSLSVDERLEQGFQTSRITIANRVFAQQYGLSSPEEIIGRKVNDFYVDSSPANLEANRRLLSGEFQITNEETEECDQLGNRRYFLSNVVANVQDGYIIGGWGTQIDITQLREAQQALLQAEQERARSAAERSQELERLNTQLQQTLDRLSESEERYRTLFEISSEGIYRFEYRPSIPLFLASSEQAELIHQNCYIPEGNQTFVEMYGLSISDEFEGLWLQNIHVQDSEQNRIFLQTLAENGHQIRNYESEEHDRQGNPRYFLNNISTIIKDKCAIGGWASQLDITELRLAQQALLEAEQNRSQLLKTVTAVANLLLRSSDYTIVLPHVLQILGEAATADRCGLIQNVSDSTSGKPAARMHTEWCRAGIQASISHTPDLESALLWETFPDGYRKLAQGETLCVFVKDLAEPTRSLLLAQGNVSMLMVPIVVQGEFWGVFGFDYCQIEQSHDEATQAIFAIAVDSIAAAIERQTQDAALHQSKQRLIEEQLRSKTAIVEERNRMAREIHDTLAQAFTGISIQLGVAKRIARQQPEVCELIEQATELAHTGLTEARRSVWSLQPDAEIYQDLAGALARSLEHLTASTSIRAEMQIHGIVYAVPPDVGMNLLRIGQEAITNALRHADARQITLHLHYDQDSIRLHVQDDGCGFDPTSPTNGGFGLVGMQQRCDRLGGQFTVMAQPGGGTQIMALVPFTAPRSFA